MKTPNIKIIASLLLALTFAACTKDVDVQDTQLHDKNKSSVEPLLAGAASVDLKLPDGVPVAGFGAGSRRNFNPFKTTRYAHLFKAARGVLDPVTAKALILQKGEHKILWLTVDLVASSPKFVEYVAARTAAWGFNKDNIFISASHTHSGPGAFADNRFWAVVALDRYHQEIFEHIGNKMLEATEQAQRQLAPAILGSTEVRIDDVTENRRGSEFLDPVATLLRVDSAQGLPIALAFNFPIHGTVQGPSNLSISADVSGAIARQIEKRTGAVALFLNGAEGDVAPKRGAGANAWEQAQNLGIKIGDAMANASNQIVLSEPQRLRHVSYNLALPSAKLNAITCLFKHGTVDFYINIGRYMPRTAPFHGVLIDDLAFVTIPGEPIVELGLDMKEFGRQLGFSKVGVVSLTNEHLGYILTPAEYERGGTESCASMYGSKLGDWVLQSAGQILTDLSATTKAP